jgi:hypothetical protein
MKYFLALLLICTSGYGKACTVCGSSSGNQYLGILPQFNKHFVGLQYQRREFKSLHPGHEANEPSSTSKEDYSTVQAWGRFNVGSRVQLFAFLPYVHNQKTEGSICKVISGVGDATVLANVRLLRLNNPEKQWRHNLQLGGGIKLPTGVHDDGAAQTADGLPNMQPGTGSWDFVLNGNYTVRRKAVGVNTEVSYTITSPNGVQYKYGNRLTAGTTGFYWYQRRAIILMPQIGIRAELAGPDYDNYRYGWKNDMAGGTQVYVSAGVQAFYKRLGLQVSYHHPVAQHYAGGLVNTKFKTEAGAFILF